METLDIIAYVILFLVWLFGATPIIGEIMYDFHHSTYKDAVHFGLVIQVVFTILAFSCWAVVWAVVWAIGRVLG